MGDQRPESEPDRLLRLTAGYVLEHGIADLTLRRLGQAIGTNNRMLLYYFGSRGTHAGEFQLPAGLFIDRDDKVFVVDSYNRRVQIFQYDGLKKAANQTSSKGLLPGTQAKEVTP